jgi:hypothetical protein
MILKEQIRRNAVALISLVIAITSLSYNTWRNEASESNRTQRLVALEVLMKLGDLQQLVWHHHYDKDFEGKGNLRTGWTLVIVIRDISQVLAGSVAESTGELHATWDDHSAQLDTSVDAKNAIIESIEVVRSDALQLLRDLD